jgi:TIGR00299 family protein
MHFLYFDCFSGVSGDMIVSALLDWGAPFDLLRSAVSGLGIGADVSCERKTIQGISCTAFKVASTASPLRHLTDIEKIITGSSLSATIQKRSLDVFHRLAAAESTVHDIDPARVHFHEIGAVDTIVDIVSVFICLESLGIENIYCSPLPWAEGFIDISHGRYPLPAPATCLLLSGFPCVFSDAGIELVTPTGAALITTIAKPLNSRRQFIPNRIAYGAGTNTRTDHVPNLLRLIDAQFYTDLETESVAVLETEVDDLNPEVFTHLHRIFTAESGVLDFFTTPVLMKKNRPGTLITLLSRPQAAVELTQRLMIETGSLGVRYRLQERYVAERKEDQVLTPWGPIRVKISNVGSERVRIKPEFDDIEEIAIQHNLPVSKVYSVVSSLISDRI